MFEKSKMPVLVHSEWQIHVLQSLRCSTRVSMSSGQFSMGSGC